MNGRNPKAEMISRKEIQKQLGELAKHNAPIQLRSAKHKLHWTCWQLGGLTPLILRQVLEQARGDTGISLHGCSRKASGRKCTVSGPFVLLSSLYSTFDFALQRSLWFRCWSNDSRSSGWLVGRRSLWQA